VVDQFVFHILTILLPLFISLSTTTLLSNDSALEITEQNEFEEFALINLGFIKRYVTATWVLS